MAVLPKQSSSCLPEWVRNMLWSAQSEIIDFYPLKYEHDTVLSPNLLFIFISINGFKYAWMGINLLPFVDEKRLSMAINKYSKYYTKEEKIRDTLHPNELLFFNFEQFPILTEIVESCNEP